MSENRYEVIDIAKGIAILGVLLVHSRQPFPAIGNFLEVFEMGQLGCQVFFVLAGYTAGISIRKIDDSQRNNRCIHFYWKKLKNIWPGYAFTIFLLLFYQLFVGLCINIEPKFKVNNSFGAILGNLLLVHGVLPFCNNNVVFGGWYVGTLIIFYLFTPFLYGVLRRVSYVICNKLWMICWAYSFLFNYLVILVFRKVQKPILIINNGFGYFSFLVQVPCFLLGLILFFEADRNYADKNVEISRNEKLIHPNRKFLYVLLSCVCFLAIIVMFFSEWQYKALFFPIIVGTGTYFALKVVFSIDFQKCIWFHKIKNKLVCWGKNSYYIYLFQVFTLLELPHLLFCFCDSKGWAINPKLIYILSLPILLQLTLVLAKKYKKICTRLIQCLRMN